MLRHLQSGERKLCFLARPNDGARHASTMACNRITRKLDVDLPTIVGELENAATTSTATAILVSP
ncbi:MAG TPA: hypothetical protein VG346_12495 [Acidimicrobiales bacterium]|jgi:hypothetical protein|nr:hypothetical protein [Acidimicrobiales bacterium]